MGVGGWVRGGMEGGGGGGGGKGVWTRRRLNEQTVDLIVCGEAQITYKDSVQGTGGRSVC